MKREETKKNKRTTSILTISLPPILANRIHSKAKKTFRSTSQYLRDLAIGDLQSEAREEKAA